MQSVRRSTILLRPSLVTRGATLAMAGYRIVVAQSATMQSIQAFRIDSVALVR